MHNSQSESQCLHIAAYNGSSEIVKLILANVKNKNPKNIYGTPLEIANLKGHLEIAQLITSAMNASEG